MLLKLGILMPTWEFSLILWKPESDGMWEDFEILQRFLQICDSTELKYFENMFFQKILENLHILKKKYELKHQCLMFKGPKTYNV